MINTYNIKGKINIAQFDKNKSKPLKYKSVKKDTSRRKLRKYIEI